MADANKLRIEFFNAQRALISGLFATNSNQAYVQMALDRMNRAFNSLMLVTLKPFEADELSPQPVQELLCAYAVNMGDDWNGSKWQVQFINGNPVSYQPTVGEFTRRMTASGWKVFSPQDDGEPNMLYTPDGDPVYALYFCRALPPENDYVTNLMDLPDAQIMRLLLSSN